MALNPAKSLSWEEENTGNGGGTGDYGEKIGFKEK